MATDLPSSMRASVWNTNTGGIEKNIKVNAHAPLPKTANALPAGCTLVKVSYATVNPVDFKIAEAPLIGNLMFSKSSPGLDYCGKVVATTLPHLKPGELVFGAVDMPKFGTLAEYAVAPSHGCVPLPNDVPQDEAACVGIVGLTAYQCIAPFVKAGDKVFINGGSGGTGSFGIQIAKALGCQVTTSCSGANVDLCKSLGADEVIDYRTQPVVETLKRKGPQFDLIVDNVFANSDIYWNAHHYMKPEGRFITIAGSPKLSVIVDLCKVFLWPSWLGGGQRSFQFVTCASNAEQYAQIAKWMQEKKVKAVIEEVFDLEDADKAYERLKTGRTRGKLVIKVAKQ